MKNLIYDKKFKAHITDKEASDIMNFKGSHLNFKGEYLKKSLIEVFNEKKEALEDKRITEYTTEELKAILGNFEKEYHEATNGEVIHNEILGYVREGNVQHALRIGAITEEDNTYYVKLPEYNDYQKKLNALDELFSRRDYAKKKNMENLILNK